MELEKLFKKSIYRKVLRFFYENPSSVDTARGVATWTNEDVKKVKTVLNHLADIGLLVAHKVSSTTGYSYTRDKKKSSIVGKLLKKYNLK